MRTASSTSLKRTTLVTGPKISVSVMRDPCCTSVSRVGA
jgi:hypothetical protein